MPYQAEISRHNPVLFVFLLDQSASMSDPFGNYSDKIKAEALTEATNQVIYKLVLRCSSGDEVRDYFHVALLAYSSSNIGSALSGFLAKHEVVTVSQLADHPTEIQERRRKVPDGAGGVVEEPYRQPVWVYPSTAGATPMCKALNRCKDLVQSWIVDHPSSYPPIVVHFTDGESTDGDPRNVAASLRDLSTTDGRVLLLNCHLSATRGNAISFPASDAGLPDQFARTLFDMSSELPTNMLEVAKTLSYPVELAARGFMYQASPVDMIEFLDVGTRAAMISSTPDR